MCHMTANQGNRAGQLIFSPYSSVSMKRVFPQESVEAAAYFQLRKVRIVAIAGIRSVDLPRLLSISFGEQTCSLWINTHILSSDDLSSHPYLKCAANVSTSLILYSYRP
ncbi:uncharacterized protein LOC122566969 [Bombus pyrosoma]|uniref:uncharacterized protein LOC122566969 n=1 Tax=Bombus pyrosoma TaxID=396416 RepID=UPI001CB8FC9E|nr:uncharacterized protein LOC122566969 [Bombus pyrosoma]